MLGNPASNRSSTNVSLLSRIRDRADHDSWREFDERYRELMLRYCRRRGLNRVDSEDVVQATFVGLSESLSRFIYDPKRGRFRDYLARCVRNEIFRHAARPQMAQKALVNGGDHCAADATDVAADAAWEEEWVAHHYRRAMPPNRNESP